MPLRSTCHIFRHPFRSTKTGSHNQPIHLHAQTICSQCPSASLGPSTSVCASLWGLRRDSVPAQTITQPPRQRRVQLHQQDVGRNRWCGFSCVKYIYLRRFTHFWRCGDYFWSRRNSLVLRGEKVEAESRASPMLADDWSLQGANAYCKSLLLDLHNNMAKGMTWEKNKVASGVKLWKKMHK